MITINAATNNLVTIEDFEIAEKMLGLVIGSLKRKTACRKPTPVVKNTSKYHKIGTSTIESYLYGCDESQHPMVYENDFKKHISMHSTAQCMASYIKWYCKVFHSFTTVQDFKT